ncbi:MAG: DUF305 domain-containing protein, partial [Jiangellaceae bacterium]
LAQMLPHHEEAVATAKELERSDRPEMRELGAAIVTTQSDEIEHLRSWLAEWYPDRPIPLDFQPMMRDLSVLSGDALDEAFLQDMIPHHMAAVMQSQQLLVQGAAEHDEVAEFGRNVRDSQHREILQMQRWLVDWFGTGSTMPHSSSRMWAAP